MMRNQYSAKQSMHTLLHVCIPYVSIHTYPRGSLIPETCSNGTLGRKQLKDSCEIQESNGNEVEKVQQKSLLFKKDGRFKIF